MVAMPVEINVLSDGDLPWFGCLRYTVLFRTSIQLQCTGLDHFDYEAGWHASEGTCVVCWTDPFLQGFNKSLNDTHVFISFGRIQGYLQRQIIHPFGAKVTRRQAP